MRGAAALVARSARQGVRRSSGLADLPHARRARTAQSVLDHLERHGITGREVVECPLGYVPPMEEHLTAIRGADEPVPLPTNDLHNPPRRRPTARIWLARFARTLRLGASRARRRWLVAHGIPFFAARPRGLTLPVSP